MAKRLLWGSGGAVLLIGGALMGTMLERHRGGSPPNEGAAVPGASQLDPAAEQSGTHSPDSLTPVPLPQSLAIQFPDAPDTASIRTDGNPGSPNENAPAASADPARALAGELSRADAFMHEGSYIAALRHYLPLLENVSGAVMRGQILLRISLCQEALGELSEAQANYRRVVGLHPPRPILEAALLGQARIWEDTGRADVAASTLLRTLLEVPRDAADRGQAQLPHQLGTLLSGRITSAQRDGTHVLDDRVLTIPRQTLRPERLIQEWSDWKADLILPTENDSDSDTLAVTQRFSSAPDEIFLTLRGNRANAWTVLRQAVRAAGWDLQASATVEQRLREHTVRPGCTDLPLSLILDALLMPHQLTWHTGDDGIHVQPSSDLSPSERRSRSIRTARRALRFACTHAPEHAGAALSFMELGRLAAVQTMLASDESEIQEGVEQAVHDYLQVIDQFPRSEHVPEAWFNIGKLRLRQGELEKALTAFHRAVDSMPGHPLEAAAYLYVGRIQLEHGRFRNAVMPLVRGLDLARKTDLEGVAAMLLASAYYLLENPTRANTVLVEHRGALNAPEDRDPAAFLAALIRFQNTRDPRVQQREGGVLVASLTNLKPHRQFGGHWWYLTVIAAQETGMIPQAQAAFAQCLDRTYSFPLQDRMRAVMLADGFHVSEDAGATEESALHVLSQARLTQAAAAFRNEDFTLTLDLTRELLNAEGIPEPHRREALGLMGRVYQLQGNHRLAIRCFTGVVPGEPPQVQERGRTSSTGGDR